MAKRFTTFLPLVAPTTGTAVAIVHLAILTSRAPLAEQTVPSGDRENPFRKAELE